MNLYYLLTKCNKESKLFDKEKKEKITYQGSSPCRSTMLLKRGYFLAPFFIL